MSTNKLSHLKDGEKIYLEVTRTLSHNDDSSSHISFQSESMYRILANDNDTFYTLEELKTLANDGMPKQGEMIDVADGGYHWCTNYTFICMYGKKVLSIKNGEFETWDKWRYPAKLTELTLAEVESRLGLDKDSLIIKLDYDKHGKG